MQKAEQQHKPERRQNAIQRARNESGASQRAPAEPTGLAELGARSLLLQRQGGAAQRIGNSERMVMQRHAFEAFRAGSRAAAQMRVMQAYGKGAAERRPNRAEPVLVQRVEEEEPLQGKFATLQRTEDEEPLQGKFVVAQRYTAGEDVEDDSDSLQGDTVQRIEEEEPLQGKLATLQRNEEEEPLQGKFAAHNVVQRKETAPTESSGLPENLRNGVESLSGMSMDHVKVHYNSPQPAQLNAHAFAQGSEIHLAAGQERHLPHEAWHVVQQAQGRVQPTAQMKTGVSINDDGALENEADVMGAKALTTPAPAIQQKAANDSQPSLVQRAGDSQETKSSGPADGAKPFHYAVTMNFDERANQAVDASSEKGKDSPAAGSASGDAVVVNPKAGLPPDQEKTLAEKGGAVVGSVSAAGSAASGIKDMVSKFSDTSKITEAVSITQTVGGILSGIAAGIVNTVTLFVKPLMDAASAFSAMKTKWSQWSAYSAAAKEGIPEAVYGEKKVKHGFIAMVTTFSMAVMDFIANLLLLIPGAQIVGGPMKLFTSIVGIGRSIMNSILKGISFFKGNKKEKNSTSLLSNAIGDGPNNKSANLVFNLGLSSIKGSFSKWINKLQSGIQKFKTGAKNWITGSGWTAPPTFLEKNQPPSNAEEMRVGLIGLKKEGGDEALAPIKEEIKQSMTGLTAEA